MSVGRGVALSDRSLQRIGSAIKISQSRKRVSEIAMSVRKVSVLLLDRGLVRTNRFFDLASRIKSVAQIVVGLGVSSSALVDRGSVRRDRFVDFAQVVKRDSEFVPSRRKSVSEGGRCAPQAFGRVFKFAPFVQREAQVVMRDGVVGPILNRRAI